MELELKYNKEKEMNEVQRKEYCASISAVFPVMEKDIKAKMYEQLVSTYTEAHDFNQILKGQGIMEGMAILLEHWKIAHLEHQSRGQEPKIENKNNPIGEL